MKLYKYIIFFFVKIYLLSIYLMFHGKKNVPLGKWPRTVDKAQNSGTSSTGTRRRYEPATALAKLKPHQLPTTAFRHDGESCFALSFPFFFSSQHSIFVEPATPLCKPLSHESPHLFCDTMYCSL